MASLIHLLYAALRWLRLTAGLLTRDPDTKVPPGAETTPGTGPSPDRQPNVTRALRALRDTEALVHRHLAHLEGCSASAVSPDHSVAVTAAMALVDTRVTIENAMVARAVSQALIHCVRQVAVVHHPSTTHITTVRAELDAIAESSSRITDVVATSTKRMTPVAVAGGRVFPVPPRVPVLPAHARAWVPPSRPLGVSGRPRTAPLPTP